MSHNWRSWSTSSSLSLFDQRSSGSKLGSLSGSEGIQLALSSACLIHSERENAENSADRTVKSCTYITSRNATPCFQRGTDKKETKEPNSHCLPDRTKLEQANITVGRLQPADGHWRLIQLGDDYCRWFQPWDGDRWRFSLVTIILTHCYVLSSVPPDKFWVRTLE